MSYFDNVSAISIPEGDVAIISRGDEILWREQKYKRELGYLENTGEQYIDTGVIPTSKTDVDLFCNYTVDKYCHCIIGGGNAYGNNELLIAANMSSSTTIITSKGNNTNVRVASASSYVGEDHRYRIAGWQFYFDDRLVGTYPTVELSTQNTMYLMAYHRNSGVGEYFIGKFYYAKIYDNGVLIRDYIPVLDWNDVPCLYDKVNKKLYYNQGAGEFAYGGDVA